MHLSGCILYFSSMKLHEYNTTIEWTGNNGTGTSAYTAYDRSYTIQSEGKPIIEGTADPAFRGDASKYNPEEMFLASIASCHMLWFLHLASSNDITVMSYTDQPVGMMIQNQDGSGQFENVILRPTIEIVQKEKSGMINALHHAASQNCFIARSLNFKVTYESTIK